jgi:hypothetical protein
MSSILLTFLICLEDCIMGREIDSKMMKRAVEVLFNHEIARNEKVSSHSQLERWIVSELALYSNPVSVKALQMALKDLRGIDFDISEPTKDDVDFEVEAEIRLRSEYKRFGFYREDTGGGCTSMTRNSNEANGYVMVTIANSCDAPDDLLSTVNFGLYDGGGNLLFDECYASSFEMFKSDLFKWVVETQ